MKQKSYVLFTSYLLLGTFLSGCATVPRAGSISTYSIRGASYVALTSLCKVRNIEWQYDSFARSAVLTRGARQVHVRVGDTMVLVDGNPEYLTHPVVMNLGTIMVPYRFSEQIIDKVFGGKAHMPLPQMPLAAKIKKVVVDAGHGGKDPGAIGKGGLREKDVNLDVAKRLATLLRARGIEVVMTRNSDVFVPLSRRVDIANSSGADIYVSVHANANRVRSLNGFEVYYISPKASDAKRAVDSAKSETLSIENARFGSQSLTLKTILWDMIYAYSRAESIELSNAICKGANSSLDVRVIGVKNANFQVLRGAHMPAVLVEMGFLSNSAEERKLKNSFYRQKVAECISDGLREYARKGTFIRTVKR